MLAIGDRTVGGIDQWDEILDDDVFECGRTSAGSSSRRSGVRCSCARPGSVAVVHDDDHGHGLLCSDQIVENHIRHAALGPLLSFIAANSVQQIQHGIFCVL